MTTEPGQWPATACLVVKALRQWRALTATLADLSEGPLCSDRGEDFYALPDTDQAELAAATCWTCPAQLACLAFAHANGGASRRLGRS